MKIVIAGQEFDVQPGEDTVSVDGAQFALRTVRRSNIVTVYVNEKPFAVQLPEQRPEDGPVKLLVDAKEYEVEVKGALGGRAKAKPAKKTKAAAAGAITSQMTGRVIKVNVQTGDDVNEGDILLVVEAMKMENEIGAPMSGKVKSVEVAAGARVSEGDLLIQLDPAAA